jgi:hypothetical protein
MIRQAFDRLCKEHWRLLAFDMMLVRNLLLSVVRSYTRVARASFMGRAILGVTALIRDCERTGSLFISKVDTGGVSLRRKSVLHVFYSTASDLFSTLIPLSPSVSF